MKTDKGFTLIELLVAVAVIGILAAIAVPQFAEYRGRGFDARAKTDLRHVATAEEAYFVDSSVYKNCTQADCATILSGLNSLSDGVTLQITATTSGFVGTSTHPAGSGLTCRWDTSNHGLVGCS